jgi:RNA polymerase sigma factor (sigma-70 family)
MAAATLSPLSLESTREGPGKIGAEAADALAECDPGYENAERRAVLEVALARLSGRARFALHLRIERGLTTAEIASRLGMSTPQAGRLIRGALGRMRLTLSA